MKCFLAVLVAGIGVAMVGCEGKTDSQPGQNAASSARGAG